MRLVVCTLVFPLLVDGFLCYRVGLRSAFFGRLLADAGAVVVVRVLTYTHR